jgi:hypothetical protein
MIYPPIGWDQLSTIHLNNTIPASTDNPLPIRAPYNRTYAFAAHEAMASNLLGARAFLHAPEPQTCVVARGDEFPSVGGEGKA